GAGVPGLFEAELLEEGQEDLLGDIEYVLVVGSLSRIELREAGTRGVASGARELGQGRRGGTGRITPGTPAAARARLRRGGEGPGGPVELPLQDGRLHQGIARRDEGVGLRSAAVAIVLEIVRSLDPEEVPESRSKASRDGLRHHLDVAFLSLLPADEELVGDAES